MPRLTLPSVYVPNFAYTLREINLDTFIVNQDILHSHVRSITCSVLLELHKGVLQGIPRLEIPDDLAFVNFPEAGEHRFQIVVFGNWIQLTHKQHIVRRTNIG